MKTELLLEVQTVSLPDAAQESALRASAAQRLVDAKAFETLQAAFAAVVVDVRAAQGGGASVQVRADVASDLADAAASGLRVDAAAASQMFGADASFVSSVAAPWRRPASEMTIELPAVIHDKIYRLLWEEPYRTLTVTIKYANEALSMKVTPTGTLNDQAIEAIRHRVALWLSSWGVIFWDQTEALGAVTADSDGRTVTVTVRVSSIVARAAYKGLVGHKDDPQSIARHTTEMLGGLGTSDGYVTTDRNLALDTIANLTNKNKEDLVSDFRYIRWDTQVIKVNFNKEEKDALGPLNFDILRSKLPNASVHNTIQITYPLSGWNFEKIRHSNQILHLDIQEKDSIELCNLKNVAEVFHRPGSVGLQTISCSTYRSGNDGPEKNHERLVVDVLKLRSVREMVLKDINLEFDVYHTSSWQDYKKLHTRNVKKYEEDIAKVCPGAVVKGTLILTNPRSRFVITVPVKFKRIVTEVILSILPKDSGIVYIHLQGAQVNATLVGEKILDPIQECITMDPPSSFRGLQHHAFEKGVSLPLAIAMHAVRFRKKSKPSFALTTTADLADANVLTLRTRCAERLVAAGAYATAEAAQSVVRVVRRGARDVEVVADVADVPAAVQARVQEELSVADAADASAAFFDGAVGVAAVDAAHDEFKVPKSAFQNNSDLEEINVPNGITDIDENAFEGAQELTVVQLPPSLTRIGFAAFHVCNSLTQIQLPDNLRYIDDMAFMKCKLLRTINLPTSLESIGNYAFEGCPLKEVTLPGKLTHIGAFAFANCVGMRIRVAGKISLTDVGEDAFAHLGAGLPPFSLKTRFPAAFKNTNNLLSSYTGSEAAQ